MCVYIYISVCVCVTYRLYACMSICTHLYVHICMPFGGLKSHQIFVSLSETLFGEGCETQVLRMLELNPQAPPAVWVWCFSRPFHACSIILLTCVHEWLENAWRVLPGVCRDAKVGISSVAGWCWVVRWCPLARPPWTAHGWPHSLHSLVVMGHSLF